MSVNSSYARTISISNPLSAFAVYAILTIIGGFLSEPSSLDSLPECQLPDWKTVVWNVTNEVDLEKSSIWFGGGLLKLFYRYGTPVVPGHSLEEIGR